MFEKGNRVRLKAGGKVMTVRRVGDFSPVMAKGVECMWFNERHKRCSAIFDTAELEKIDALNGGIRLNALDSHDAA